MIETAELNFIETDAGIIKGDILDILETECGEPLYPGDERRIYGEALAAVVIAVYNAVNDGCRQRLLRYARGGVLDALGENRDCARLDPTYATTILRFGVDEAYTTNIIIPAGTRATGDYVRYFKTDATTVLYAGQEYVDVNATAEEAGSEYNDIGENMITQIVDVSDIPLIDWVTNLTVTSGGGDIEDDDTYRERIRESENRLSTAGPYQAYRYWALSANARISDVTVESTKETVERTLPVHDGYAFQGGANLLPETLVVSLPDGTPASSADYTAEYDDELLTIQLFGALASESEISISITRWMYGRVKIVPICAGGELPDEQVLQDVLETCSADTVRPLTDIVEVEAPDVVYYDIDIEYYTTLADESEAIENIEGADGAINQYIYWQDSSLNQDINPDQLRKLILCPHDLTDDSELTGATRVIVNLPEYTELTSTQVAKFSGSLTVKHYIRG